jgi:Uma2 family endonuclease
MAVQTTSVQPPASTEPDLITGEQLAAMGDIGPCELVEGRIVTMSLTKSPHGRLEIRLRRLLDEFVEEHNLGEVQGGEVGLYTHRNPDTIRATDILFVSHERLAQATPGRFLDVASELVVEILSPDDRWSAIKKKLREYLDIGVKVVLVIDPDERTISAYRALSDAQEFSESDVLTLEDVLPGFSVPVTRLLGETKPS